MRLVQEFDPGSRLLGIRRLRGGISARTFELKLEKPNADPRRVVLRIYVPGHEDSDAGDARREFKTLALLAETPVPAPRPLLLDAEGRFFGAPAMVIERLPGRPLLTARNQAVWLGRMAEGLFTLHSLDTTKHDLSHVGVWLEAEVREKLGGPVEPRLARDALGMRLWETLRAQLAGVTWLPPCLVHSDFWPGNTVWHRGRLSGIVDWGSAELGDPRADVAQCRLDLAMMLGPDAAGTFLSAYESLRGAPLPDMPFCDLYRSRGALAHLHYWADGYSDLGLSVGLEELRRRLEVFVLRALGDLSS